MSDLELYLHPTYFIDSDHESIRRMAKELTSGISADADKAIALFYFVRDTYKYTPYHVDFTPRKLKASYILAREGEKIGYCIEKAVLFCTLCRAAGIPNRMIFCNVRNHIAAEKFEEIIGTNLMVFHGYNEVYVNDKWVKCTVAFNKALCDKLGVATLEFDGIHDEIFQEYDHDGGLFMVYETDYGVFHDVPHDLWLRETLKYYGHLFEKENMDTMKKRMAALDI